MLIKKSSRTIFAWTFVTWVQVRITCLCSTLKIRFSLLSSCQHLGRQRRGARELSMRLQQSLPEPRGSGAWLWGSGAKEKCIPVEDVSGTRKETGREETYFLCTYYVLGLYMHYLNNPGGLLLWFYYHLFSGWRNYGGSERLSNFSKI